MREGDIYRWEFKDPKDFMPYHCCSRIARFDGKTLRDTYWSSYGEGKAWDPERADALLDLTFLANEADLESYGEDAYLYYGSEDIVDLRHPNNSSRDLVYIRRGAHRRLDVMRKHLQAEIDRAEYQARCDAERAQRLRDDLAKLTAENMNEAFLPRPSAW